MAAFRYNGVVRAGRKRYRVTVGEPVTYSKATQSLTAHMHIQPIPWWKFWVRR